jgi:MFS family permease
MTATGYASVVPTVLAVSGTHAAHQGHAVGLVRVAADVALLTAPVLAGMLSDGFGLRAAIVIPGVLTVVIGLLSSFALAKQAERRPVGP